MNCYHGVISVTEAEQRLRGNRLDSSYLVRESTVKEGTFILCYLLNDVVTEVIIPSAETNYLDAALDIEHVIRSVEHRLLHPVTGPVVTRTWRVWSSHQSPELTCPVCSEVFTDKKKRQLHERNHKLSNCDKCQLYVRMNGTTKHKKRCKGTGELLSCHFHGCDYSTHWVADMTKHKVCVT